MEQVKKKTITKKAVDLSNEDKEPSFFDIPKAIKAELEAKGLVGRWINAKKYQDNYGFHKSGWKAHKTSPNARLAGSLDFGDGIDAEGFIRRGDLVLATKSAEQQARHKATIDKKTAALSNFTKSAAEEVRKTLGDKGTVIEGYEENGGDD